MQPDWMNGILAAAIAALWVVHIRSFKQLEKRTTECEKDRLDLWCKVSELSSSLCDRPDCPKHKSILNHQQK